MTPTVLREIGVAAGAALTVERRRKLRGPGPFVAAGLIRDPFRGAAMAAVLPGLGAVDGAAPVTVKESRRLRGPTPANMIETVFVRTVRDA